MVYYQLHAQTSNIARIRVRQHTITLAIVHTRTKELMVDITHKADFGYNSVRLRGRNYQPLTREDVAIAANETGPLNFRSINVLNMANPNPEFKNRKPVPIGTYEIWQTRPICTVSVGRGGVQVVFRQPATGIKTPDSLTKVNLGRKYNNRFFKSTGLNRHIRMAGLQVSSKHCPEGAAGKFYTNPSATTVLEGPGRNAIRQYVKPEFSVTIDGRFEAVDNWVGMHAKGWRGFFHDHGYGIDPNKN